MLKVLGTIFIGLLFWGGCSSAQIRPSSEKGHPHEGAALAVLRSDIFEQGGKVMVDVFKAGDNAEATPVLDRYSLNVLRGMADALSDTGARFQFVRPDAGIPVDFVIEGHIDEFRSPGFLGRLMFKKDLSVRISAEVKSVAGGEVVARISARQKVRNDRKRLDASAYSLGISMGRELNSGGGNL